MKIRDKINELQKAIQKSEKAEYDSWVSDAVSTVHYFNKREDREEPDILVDYALDTIHTYPSKYELTNQLGLIEHNAKYHIATINKNGSIQKLLGRMYHVSKKGNYVLFPAHLSTIINREDEINFKKDKHKLAKFSKLAFKKSNLFAIDIDKTLISPSQLLSDIPSLSNIVAGIVPTPSNLHPDKEGKRKYSYRLFFVSKEEDYVAGNQYYTYVMQGLIMDINDLLESVYNDATIIKVDGQTPKTAYQKIRCGKGEYWINNEVVYISPSQVAQRAKDSEFVSKVEGSIDTKRLADLKRKFLDATYTVSSDILSKMNKIVIEVGYGEETDEQNTKEWLAYTVGLVHLVLLGYATYEDVNEHYLTISDHISNSDTLFEREYKKAVNNKVVGDISNIIILRKVYEKNGGKGEDILVTNYKDVEEELEEDGVLIDTKINKANRDFMRLFKQDGKNVVKKEIKKFLETESVMTNLFGSRKGKYLMVAPTGSGKTKAIFECISILKATLNLRKDNLILIAVPNCSNVLQNADKYDKSFFYGAASIENKFKERVLESYTINNNNVYVSTYDSIKIIYNILKSVDPAIKINLLITDEVHQMTSNYGYRRNSCQGIIELMSISDRAIGMTGTVADCNPALYDNLLIYTKESGDSIPAKSASIMQYRGRKELVEYISHLITTFIDKEYEQLLIFVENKSIHDELSIFSNNRGISTVQVNADNKDDDDVLNLFAKEQIDVQVILATSLISDGDNIINPIDKKQAVFIVSGSDSDIYSASMFRQMSNRYRNEYEQLIWFRPRIKDGEECKYNKVVPTTNKLYHYNLRKSELILEQLNLMELAGDIPKRDMIEKYYNIKFAKNKNTDALEMSIDKNGVYHKAYNDRARRHKRYLLHLQQEIENAIGMEFNKVMDLCQVDEKTIVEIENIREERKREEKELLQKYLANIENTIPLDDYKYITYDANFDKYNLNKRDENVLQKKSNILKAMPKQLEKAVISNSFLPYELFIKATVDVFTNKKSKSIYYDTMDRYTSILEYNKYGKSSATYTQVSDIRDTIQEVVSNLGISDIPDEHKHPVAGDYLLKKDRKLITDKVRKKSKYAKEAVDKTLNKYMHFKRIKQVRFDLSEEIIQSTDTVLNLPTTNIETSSTSTSKKENPKIGLYTYDIYTLEDLRKELALTDTEFYNALLAYVQKYGNVSDSIYRDITNLKHNNVQRKLIRVARHTKAK